MRLLSGVAGAGRTPCGLSLVTPLADRGLLLHAEERNPLSHGTVARTPREVPGTDSARKSTP